MFILSDAGMGKTALLTMLKLMEMTSLWPRQKRCILKKLGKDTLAEIGQIKNRSGAILLSLLNAVRHFLCGTTALICRLSVQLALKGFQ